MILRFGNWNGFSYWIASAEESAQLHFIIQQAARRINWRSCRIRHDLPPGTADRRTAHDDGGSAAVIRDGHPFVVREQRIIGTEHAADVGGMIDGRVEIRVIGNIGGKKQIHSGDWMQEAFGSGGIVREVIADDAADIGACAVGHRHHAVHRLEVERLRGIQQHVADCDPQTRPLFAAPAECSVGKILNREIGVGAIGRFHPAFQRRIMCLVDH